MTEYCMSQQLIQAAIDNPLLRITCADIHPAVSCNQKMLYQFLRSTKNVYKVYMLVHVGPLLLFGTKKLLLQYSSYNSRPGKEIKKLLTGLVKSILFASGHSTIAMRVICLLIKYYRFESLNSVIGCLVGSLSVLFEHPSRQPQIALFCVNKSVETLYNMALRRKYPVRIPYGECLLVGTSLAVVVYHFNQDPTTFRQNYRKVLSLYLDDL